jgi:DNA-binding transcriptional LysR family regulator
MDPDLQQLRSFVAVAEELHFGRAGLRLGLSQPQVSRHVRSLEDALGVPLFVRTARRTVLTDAGARLLQDAQETLAAARRLQTRAADIERARGGRVAVGFLWSTLGGYLPPLVAATAERHHGIELSVSQQTVLEIVPALRRGDIDLVISRPLQQESEMVELTLRREPSVLAIPEGHPLADRPTVVLEDLADQPMIALKRALAPAAYDMAINRARARGINFRIVQHVRSAGEALALVSAGIGLYRLPASAAPPHRGVVYRELTGVPSRVVLMRRPEPPSPPVAAVAELAFELFHDASGASKNGSARLEAEVVGA